jgi:tetratricopeptide (TPR) repeat protein
MRYGLMPAVSLACAAAVFLCGCGRTTEETYVAAAGEAFELGDHRVAVDLLERAVLEYPNSASIQCNLGVAYWKSDRPDKALGPLMKAAVLMPKDPRPLEFVGQVLLSLEQWQDAIEILTRARELDPGSPRIPTAIAFAEYKQGRMQIAHDILMTVLDATPGYAPALYNVAILHRDRPVLPGAARVGLDNKTLAARYFQKYLDAGTDERRLKKARDFVAAVRESVKPPTPARKAAAVTPSTPPVPPETVTVTPPTPPEPPPAPPKVVPKTAASPVPPDKDDPVLVMARTAMEAARFDEALIMLKDAVRADPDRPDVQWELAVLYDKHLGHKDRAADAYRAFAQRFPDDPRSAGIRKRTPPAPPAPPPSRGVRDPEKALSVWGEGLKCHNAGDLDGAMAHYRQALKHDAVCINALYNLGLVYKAKGYLKEAEEQFRATLKAKPSMYKANYMLGVVYKDLRRYAEAADYLNKALQVRPDYPKAHYVMGLVCEAQGQVERARLHFKRCIALAPNDDLSKDARQRLTRQARR